MAPSSSTPSLPRVQFVSKPMDPPYRDGSKCLVRDLCLNLTRYEPHVLSANGKLGTLGQRTVAHRAYRSVGGYRPALWQNLQAAAWLGAVSRADLWHFVFAPNSRSSQAARLLKRLRGVPTLQTVASPPRSFENPTSLLFGDLVVTQSAWTQERFVRAARDEGTPLPEIVEIPPPAPRVTRPHPHAGARVRHQLGLGADAPLFLYPGDLEISGGARRVLSWASELWRRVPGARLVIAYRDKTRRADQVAQELRASSDPSVVSIERNVPDIIGLLAESTAVLFPVEDLYGKVDLPIVLLEALALGTPVLALDHGPLKSLKGASLLPGGDAAWLTQASRMAADPAFRKERSVEGQRAVAQFYDPTLIGSRYEALYDRLRNSFTRPRSAHSQFP